VCDGALYKSAPIKTKGRGGGKYIPCYTLAKKFNPYLKLWLNERARIGIESEWLFPSKDNPDEHIGTSTVNSWAETFTRISGRDFYAHSLRHYFTTSLARAGIPDGVIQSIVAWESSDMVRLYTDIDADEQIGMYFSNGDISVPDKKSFADM
jgi:integrase